MRAGQVKVFRGALAQIIVELAPVNFDDVFMFVDDGNDQRAVEVFVSGGAQDAEALQLAA